MTRVSILFGYSDLFKRVMKTCFPGFTFSTQLNHGLSFAAQGFDRLVLREFSVTNLCLQVAHHALRFSQRSFGLLTSGRFGCQGSLGALQATAGGCNCGGDTAMDGRFVALIPAQNGYRNVAVLDKTSPMQPTIEAVTQTRRLVHPF